MTKQEKIPIKGPRCKFNIGDKVWVYTHEVYKIYEIERHIVRARIIAISIEKYRARNWEPTVLYSLEFEDGLPHGLDHNPPEDKIFATKEECIEAHTKEHNDLLQKFRKEFLERREERIEYALEILKENDYDDLETLEKKVNRINIKILDDTVEPDEISDLDYALGIRQWVTLYPALMTSSGSPLDTSGIKFQVKNKQII